MFNRVITRQCTKIENIPGRESRHAQAFWSMQQQLLQVSQSKTLTLWLAPWIITVSTSHGINRINLTTTKPHDKICQPFWKLNVSIACHLPVYFADLSRGWFGIFPDLTYRQKILRFGLLEGYILCGGSNFATSGWVVLVSDYISRHNMYQDHHNIPTAMPGAYRYICNNYSFERQPWNLGPLIRSRMRRTIKTYVLP